jgi:glucuronokinase
LCSRLLPMHWVRTSSRATTAARAALAGNPSDGFAGFVVSTTIESLRARVSLVVGDVGDHSDVDSDAQVLLDASAEIFDRFFGLPTGVLGWAVRTNIPREVGLSGSSAIIISALRCLAACRGVDLPAEALAPLALAAETEVLGWRAGLQDRLVQSIGGLVAMDFGPDAMVETATRPCGRAVVVDHTQLGPCFVAWSDGASESSDLAHARRSADVAAVVAAMNDSASAGREAAAAIQGADQARLGAAMGRTWQNRLSVFDVRREHIDLVERYGAVHGVWANSAGSGGSVVGVIDRSTAAVGIAAVDDTARAAGDHLVWVSPRPHH